MLGQRRRSRHLARCQKLTSRLARIVMTKLTIAPRIKLPSGESSSGQGITARISLGRCFPPSGVDAGTSMVVIASKMRNPITWRERMRQTPVACGVIATALTVLAR